MESNESRVRRLMAVLSRHAADECVVVSMATLLNYDVDVLRRDLEAIDSVEIRFDSEDSRRI